MMYYLTMKLPRSYLEKAFIFAVLGILVLGVGISLFRRTLQTPLAPRPADIETFEECAEAGYPIMEIYPEQCRTPDGRLFTRVTPVTTPSPITLTGTYDCLPKKDTGDPVTMECAFGLHANDGDYALDLSNIPSDDYPAINNGDRITVVGTLVPPESVSRDRWTTFDVTGIVSVDKISL
jgi:hypothetical protein